MIIPKGNLIELIQFNTNSLAPPHVFTMLMSTINSSQARQCDVKADLIRPASFLKYFTVYR